MIDPYRAGPNGILLRLLAPIVLVVSIVLIARAIAWLAWGM
jgi:hypothetical protein